MSAASENLRTNQEQCDMDGCYVKVSRQAVEETLEQFESLLEAAQAFVVAIRNDHSIPKNADADYVRDTIGSELFDGFQKACAAIAKASAQ